jgi:hypothetical protein
MLGFALLGFPLVRAWLTAYSSLRHGAGTVPVAGVATGRKVPNDIMHYVTRQ